MRRGRSLFGWLGLCAALSGCPATTPPPPEPSRDASASPPPAPPVTAAPTPVNDVDTCLDAALEAAGLNRYGDPRDLMYAGGSPLFDERTGTRTPRVAYVRTRRPDLVTQCEKR